MKITKIQLKTILYERLQEYAPVRQGGRAVGKRGTNMYSPYPGNLKNNGIYMTNRGVVLDYDRVGYIGYANIRSHKPGYIEKGINAFLGWCIAHGGRISYQ